MWKNKHSAKPLSQFHTATWVTKYFYTDEHTYVFSSQIWQQGISVVAVLFPSHSLVLIKHHANDCFGVTKSEQTCALAFNWTLGSYDDSNIHRFNDHLMCTMAEIRRCLVGQYRIMCHKFPYRHGSYWCTNDWIKL